jgi:hypothetical protein
MNKVIDFPPLRKSEKITEEIMKAMLKECNKQGLNTHNQDFVFDMAWVQKFAQATVDNQCNVANDLIRLTRAQGLK